jgi:membrane protein YdbS with pleckstrin-like domain
MTVKSKSNTKIDKTMTKDFTLFIYDEYINSQDYPDDDPRCISQYCCKLALFLLFSISCLLFIFFFLYSTGFVYHNIFEYHPILNTTETQELEIKTSHYFNDGKHVVVLWIAIPLFIISILYAIIVYCCVIPYKEWVKDLEKRKLDLEEGERSAED